MRAVELERRDVVREPRFTVCQVPVHVGGFDASEAGEEAPGELAYFRPGDVLQARFPTREGVPQG